MKIAAENSIVAALALLAAAAAIAAAGCNRARYAPADRPQRAQGAPRPRTSPAGFVYITNNGEGTISEFARAADGDLEFLRTEKAGAPNGPTGIAIDPSGRFLYVANEGEGRIHQFRIDRDTGQLLPIGDGSVDDDGVASHPQQIAVSPRGGFAYVTNSGNAGEGKKNDGSIAEYAIDPSTGALKPIETLSGGGLQQPLGIAFTPDGRFAFVSDAGAGTLVSFAVEPSGKLKLVAATPSLGDKPGRPGLVAVNPAGSFVYATDRSTGSVVVAKLAEDGRLSVTKAVHVGVSTSGPFAIAAVAVGPRVFIYTGNLGIDTVSSLVVKPDGLEHVADCPTGMGYPTGMAIDGSGRNLYVVNRNASTVARFALAESGGIALIPAASIFTEAAPSDTSHPTYIATTRWDAPASAVPIPAQHAN
ncbi:MAG TPA: beta-propeller fold lactonase family protein [Candidatus Binataceae bacterium]